MRAAARDLAGRAAALREVAERLHERADELARRLVGHHSRVRKLAHAEVRTAARRLLTVASVDPRSVHRPVGTVALLLPSNAALVAPLKAIACAYLPGNRVRVRFPRATAWLGEIIRDLLRPLGDAVAIVDMPGPDFLRTQMAPGEADVTMVYGDDGWAERYETTARHSPGTFIFEGPGKDPFLVLPGADLDRAAEALVRSAFYNGGQACTSPERVYVDASLAVNLLDRVLPRVQALVVGPADDPRTDIGPFTNAEVVRRFLAQVDEAQARGATRLWPPMSAPLWRHAPGGGIWLEPVLLTDVDHEMRIMRDETFGPALPIQRVSSSDAAVSLAEDSRYGLTASVFGSSTDVARRLRRTHGVVFENETWHEFYEREPLGPMGGFRRSGWVWQWVGDAFIRREGPRRPLEPFSREEPSRGSRRDLRRA